MPVMFWVMFWVMVVSLFVGLTQSMRLYLLVGRGNPTRDADLDRLVREAGRW